MSDATPDDPSRPNPIEKPVLAQPGVWEYRGVRIISSDDPKRAPFLVELTPIASAKHPMNSQRVDTMEEACALIDQALGV